LLTGWPLHTVYQMEQPERCMGAMLELIVRMGKCGLIHGDFNEFNVAVSKEDSSKIVMYDFPQMVSMNHPNAKMYFNRDVEGIYRFFSLRFGVDVESFERPDFEDIFSQREKSLDVQVGASGFSKEDIQYFEVEMEKERNKVRTEDAESEEEGDEEEAASEDGEQVETVSAVEEAVEQPDVSVENPEIAGGNGDDKAPSQGEEDNLEEDNAEDGRRERVQKEVARLIRKQMRGSKSSRNTVKNRERRKVRESMNDW